ncbi:PEGA domain-containing protein [Luteimonas aquatica]|uniref:PEGA domain-containing protein n=1 Tax=Luteimonas aquatica TaxID=450364 RepID=UPI00241227A2|nr:PEGA domain-containing protein [Luteimonas aquatica]
MRFLLLAALGALCLNGCATITRGSSQAWTVETDPVGADIALSSGETCKSPCTLKKKRKHPFTVTINKPGYAPVTTDVQSSISGAGAAGMAGNVLLGGLIGAGIDAGTGAMRDLKPNPLVVKLEPAADAAPPADAADAPVATATPATGAAAAASGEAIATDAGGTPSPATAPTAPAASAPPGETPAAVQPQAAPSWALPSSVTPAMDKPAPDAPASQAAPGNP